MKHRARAVIRPRPAPPEEELRTALTFFVTPPERRAILASLKRIDRDRTRALRIAAGCAPRDGKESQ